MFDYYKRKEVKVNKDKSIKEILNKYNSENLLSILDEISDVFLSSGINY